MTSPRFFMFTAVKYSLQTKFNGINATLLVGSLCLLFLIAYHMFTSFAQGVAKDYAELYSFKTASSLSSLLTHEITILQGATSSENIRSWFTKVDGPQKDTIFSETQNYVRRLHSGLLYYGVLSAKQEYHFNKDSTPKDFSPVGFFKENNSADAWFFETAKTKNTYELNVDTDKTIKRTLVWINHKVLSPEGTFLGIISTGVNFDKILHAAFDAYNVKNIRGVIINRQGYVQMDSALYEEGDNTHQGENLIQDSDWHISNILDEKVFLDTLNTHLSTITDYNNSTDMPKVVALPASSAYDYVALTPIAGADWTVVTFFNSSTLYSSENILPLLWFMVAIFLIYVIFLGITGQKLIFIPLKNLVESLKPTRNAQGEDEYGKIYGLERHDEWGILSTTIQNLRDNLASTAERARAASAAKSNFLAHMSHEIRTPMNAIIGMAKIGIQSTELKKSQTCHHKIEDASTHLLGIINDVLDMSKIEANKIDIIHNAFDFTKMLQRVAQVISYRISEKGQQFILNIDQDIPLAVISDEQRVAQVITNFLSNAEKFTPAGGSITLSVALIQMDDVKCTIKVSVTDTGIGVAKEHQRHLFTPFQQAHSGISQKFGGTGLGLAICKEIIKLLGGKLFFHSEENKGTEIGFTLPCPLPQNPNLCLREEEDTSQCISTLNFKGKKFLLAEDIEINREIIMAILEKTEVSFDIAEDGKQAVELFTANPHTYALILMDIRMPNMDGYEATKAIRALGTTEAQEIPIVAMTANAFREDREKCLQEGMQAHVSKPIDFNELYNVLKRFVK